MLAIIGLAVHLALSNALPAPADDDNPCTSSGPVTETFDGYTDTVSYCSNGGYSHAPTDSNVEYDNWLDVQGSDFKPPLAENGVVLVSTPLSKEPNSGEPQVAKIVRKDEKDTIDLLSFDYQCRMYINNPKDKSNACKECSKSIQCTVKAECASAFGDPVTKELEYTTSDAQGGKMKTLPVGPDAFVLHTCKEIVFTATTEEKVDGPKSKYLLVLTAFFDLPGIRLIWLVLGIRSPADYLANKDTVKGVALIMDNIRTGVTTCNF
ncbi:uncharacterized protein AB675_2789 [Cyphellophora attinorum]|uniref:Uncharacterized protein n=1 Tax=Cyphellophora attinorum TaxID=1664694 RepID=A0A0N0NRQ3_9EURO|nr:uncharacterized protein AB675_2789 [Phialophora attinorum]KPI45358.1 hypothetical protein AB675_2789 [Phialophora attinorum]